VRSLPCSAVRFLTEPLDHYDPTLVSFRPSYSRNAINRPRSLAPGGTPVVSRLFRTFSLRPDVGRLLGWCCFALAPMGPEQKVRR